jgi:putative oxidoreductase
MFYNDHTSVAALIIRVFLGILFLFQGYDKVFKVKISGVVTAFQIPAGNRNITSKWLIPVAAFTSWAEFLGGALLILGIFKYFALYLLGLDLIIVAVGFSFLNPIWDLRHVFPRLVLLSVLLLLPPQWDVFSLDHLLKTF